LSAVAILPNGLAWAAGTTNGTPARTLIKRWDGTGWVQVPSPSASLYNNRLYGIAVSAPNDVWAVGEYYTPGSNGSPSGNSLPLVLHWDGAIWRVVETQGLASTGAFYRELRQYAATTCGRQATAACPARRRAPSASKR